MNFEVSQVYNGNKTSQSQSTMNLRGYEDLGVGPLENTHVAKRCRYLNPNSTIWPMGYGLVTSLYKYKHKKPTILNNHFDNLPEEVVLHIFSMLDKRSLSKCAYVCSQWRRIAYDESLWYCLNIPCRRMSVMALDNLLKRNVKFLSISHANIYVDIKFYTFESLFPKLQYLDMSAVFIPVEILNSLLRQCRNLVKLSLENCHVDHSCCENIGRNTKLKVLNMASTSGLDRIGLNQILSLNLEELNLSWTRMKDDDLQCVVAYIKPSIKRLNISGFLKQLTDCDLFLLVLRCRQLIELDISDSLAITSDSLDFILFYLPNLRVLSMSRCYNVGSAFLEPSSLKLKLSKTNNQLKELNVFGMANQQLLNTDFDINKSIFSSIARPKMAYIEDTVWEIPGCKDC